MGSRATENLYEQPGSMNPQEEAGIAEERLKHLLSLILSYDNAKSKAKKAHDNQQLDLFKIRKYKCLIQSPMSVKTSIFTSLGRQHFEPH